MKKYSFTLAEVLITLGIIGIVAAMTLPVLIGKYEKSVTVNTLKKTYATLQEVITLSQKDNGDAQNWEIFSYSNSTVIPNQNIIISKFVETHILPYLKDLKHTDGMQGLENRYKSIDGTIPDISGVNFYGITLVNGVKMFFRYNNSGPLFTNVFIIVDINGTKGPNVYGRDVFCLILEPNTSKINMFGHSLVGESSINQHCSATSSGSLMCGAKIMRDGWQMKNDYP